MAEQTPYTVAQLKDKVVSSEMDYVKVGIFDLVLGWDSNATSKSSKT